MLTFRHNNVVPEFLVSAAHLVDVEVLELGILVQPLDAEFSADSALFIAAERRPFGDQMPLVDPDGAGTQLPGDCNGTLLVARPDAAPQPVLRIVRHGNCVLFGSVLDD